MTNKHKFKAWDKISNQMTKVILIDFVNKIVLLENYKEKEHHEITERNLDEVKLLQYTGMKDKNEVEIYEGDIIEYKYYYAFKRWWNTTSEIEQIEKEVQKQRDNFEKRTNKIIYKEGKYSLGYVMEASVIEKGYEIVEGQNHQSDYEEKFWDFEVIGNYYQNPELSEE